MKNNIATPKKNKINSRSDFWEQIYNKSFFTIGKYYHQWISRVYKFIIPEGLKVLEIGCGQGDLLATLKPSLGVGVDFAPTAIKIARNKYPYLHFYDVDASEISLQEKEFDFIILSDIVNDIWDVQAVFEVVHRYTHPGTRIVINYYNHLWEMPLKAAQRLGLATPLLPQNWLTTLDIRNILQLSDFEFLRSWSEMAIPLRLPAADIFNRVFSKIIPFRWFSLINIVIARPETPSFGNNTSCSVIIAARNEEGHIEELFERIPELGPQTEIIFVEGNSKDRTYETIQLEITKNPERNCKLIKQSGKGKGDAVRAGFAAASGDVLMILDADMTVPPEDLQRFYNAIVSGKGEFINGVRLVYPMEEKAMRFFNMVGNKFFAAAFSWLLGQPIRDTLCGTKVMWRKDYQRLADNRSYFGDFDPFGDFDLIFGAAKLNLKILELPVRYHARRYGETNISRWSHGVLLLKMVFFAAKRIKFF